MQEKCTVSGIAKAFCVCGRCATDKMRRARREGAVTPAPTPPAPSLAPRAAPSPARPVPTGEAAQEAPNPEPKAPANAGTRAYKRSTKMPPGSYGKVLPARVLRFQGQPRLHFDPVKLRAFADGIETDGQQQPATVRWLDDDPDYDCELIDGERRKLSCAMKGLPLWVLVKEVLSLEQHFEMAATSNFHRENHTAFEIALASKRLVESGWTISKVATGFGFSVSYINQCLSLTRLAPEVQALLHPDLQRNESLRNVVAVDLAKYSHAFQRTLAPEIVGKGLSAVAAREYIRERARERGEVADTPKNSKRSPNKDYKNLKSRLLLARTRLGLAENMDADTIATMFANRNPADHAEIIEELTQLSQQAERLLELFGGLELKEKTESS